METHATDDPPAPLTREDFHEARAIAALDIARDLLRERPEHLAIQQPATA